ncbi:hypothetical protein HDV00_003645 [Rhizophlyctis rosea]|nr:hypothetical protein HDV00_003645 [Rhizophlyctis rosea]
MPYPELKDVYIMGWRDTNVSIPVPMDASQGITFSNGGEQGFIAGIWGQNMTYETPLFPHPALICGMHNADYIEVGNVSHVGPNNTLVVWVPEFYYDLAHMTAAYASYVFKTRDANGLDTVAVHMRIRPDPKKYSLSEYLCLSVCLKALE